MAVNMKLMSFIAIFTLFGGQLALAQSILNQKAPSQVRRADPFCSYNYRSAQCWRTCTRLVETAGGLKIRRTTNARVSSLFCTNNPTYTR